MTLNNPPDQPSVEQITTKNNFSNTPHDHHPLTGTPFPENNTATPTTPATPATLATLATTNSLDSNHALTPHTPATPTTLATLATGDHPAANLASSPAIPATPTTLTTLATTDHLDSNFPLPLTTLEHTTLPSIVTLSAVSRSPEWNEVEGSLSMGREMLRCGLKFTTPRLVYASLVASERKLSMTLLSPYYCPSAIELYGRHVPVYVTLNISFLERHHVLPHEMVN